MLVFVFDSLAAVAVVVVVVVVVFVEGLAVPIDVSSVVVVVAAAVVVVAAAVVVVVVEAAVVAAALLLVVVVRCVVVDKFRLVVAGCWVTYEERNDKFFKVTHLNLTIFKFTNVTSRPSWGKLRTNYSEDTRTVNT